MLKVSAPFVRELPVTVDGKNLVLKIEPPGYTIGLRKRHERTTYHVPVLDVWKMAQGNPETKQKGELPKHLKTPSVKDEILKILHAQGRLNIAQVMQQLKAKRMSLTRPMAGEILGMMKDLGQVKQEGFDYLLSGNKH
jgi:hypothetical protein